MRKEIKELFEELDNTVDLALRASFEADDISDVITGMDSDSFKGLQSLLTAYNKAKRVNIELAEKIDDMDYKLDKVIHMLETK